MMTSVPGSAVILDLRSFGGGERAWDVNGNGINGKRELGGRRVKEKWMCEGREGGKGVRKSERRKNEKMRSEGCAADGLKTY